MDEKEVIEKMKRILNNHAGCFLVFLILSNLVGHSGFAQDTSGGMDFKEKREVVEKIKKGEVKLDKNEKKKMLRDILKNERDSVTRENALRELAKTKDSDVLDELISNLKSEDEELILASLSSIVEYSTHTKARNAVLGVLSNKNEKIRWQAVITCGEMKNPNCVDGLVKIINTEKNEQIIRSAFDSLYKIRTTKAVNSLKTLLTSSKDENIRNMASNVIKVIEVERKKKK
ncbi:MAG TPA: HEAT repeat domain-containing protein [Elusimicrobiales bacterium]|nr:HEAT repeat domain-containing protein [Elusimicrobiales bacterium]HPO95558.1 HEAT repeat domain-containing protein [Elusimicrobiales bacterium]